jgi:ABC-2 type transport system permease protein
MPIYDQGYRRYEARGALRQVRFWPITREALRMILSKRAFLGLLAVSFLPLLWYVGRTYLVTRVPDFGRVLPADARMFGEFLNIQVSFTMFLSIFGASGLIANDLRTGGILVYLSRPLTRRDYVLGKLCVPLSLNLAVTLVPGLALYIVALALAPDQFAKWELTWVGPAIVLQALIVSLFVSLLVLAVSALSRTTRVAGLAFFGLLFGLEMVRLILQHGFGRREAMVVSFLADLRSLGVSLFGLADRELAMHWAAPAAVLIVVSLACLVILRVRVRAVEIVT